MVIFVVTGVAVMVGVVVTSGVVVVAGGVVVIGGGEVGIGAPNRKQITCGLLPKPQGQMIESRATAGQPVIPQGAFQLQASTPVFSAKA